MRNGDQSVTVYRFTVVRDQSQTRVAEVERTRVPVGRQRQPNRLAAALIAHAVKAARKADTPAAADRRS